MRDAMPLGLLIDVKGSQELEIERRKDIIDAMERGRQLLMAFPKNLMPVEPAITEGDLLETVVTKWYPLTYLFHTFLRFDIPFRGGLGTGTLDIKKETVDKSDGPVLWSARKALDHAKRRHQKISLNFGRETTNEDKLEAFTAYLSIGMILNMTRMQRKYSFAWIWTGKNITEISQEVNKSKAAISTTLKRANAYILHDLLTLRDASPDMFPSVGKESPSRKMIDDR